MDFQHLGLFASAVFFGLFAIINPIGNVPVFLGLVQKFDSNTQRMIARKSTLIGFSVLILFELLGKFIFEAFGITLPAFQITGGLLVLHVGYNMIVSDGSEPHGSAPDAHMVNMKRMATSMAISPLAVPILAGPGTIATAMNLSGVYPGWEHLVGIVVITAFIFGMTYLLFASAERLVKYVGPDLIVVFSKLMGLIIAVVGTQMIISGVTKVVEGILQS